MAPTEQQARQAKALQLAGKKSTKARVQRYLQSTGPQLRERGAKKTLLLHGQRSSQTMHHVLNEWRTLQGPHNTKLLTKKNPIAVFDDAAGQQSLEFLMTKNDAALVVMATHNKKRPNNLILGRSFDRVLLDTVELGVTYFKSMQQYGGAVAKKRVGSKPLLLFQGDVWQRSNDYRQLQNMLTDFYRGDVVDQLVASGVDHMIVFTAAEDPTIPGSSSNSTTGRIRILQRTYHVQLKKNPDANVAAPAAYLTSCGPDLDFVLRRTAWADLERYRAARQQPGGSGKKSKSTKKKNQSTNVFGETIGRLHLAAQDVDRMGGRKAKALRRAEQTERNEELQAVEADLEREKEQEAAAATGPTAAATASKESSNAPSKTKTQ